MQQAQSAINKIAINTVSPIYVTQPALPQLQEFIPYLEEIWASKILTNGGPFHQQLEKALCDYLGVQHLALFSNGTLGLVTALQALRVTGAPGSVVLADIGDYVDSLQAPVDCVTARAVAPLHMLLGFAAPLVQRGAKALFLKGQDVEAELTEATKYWNIEPLLHPSRTGGHGWIVELNTIERR